MREIQSSFVMHRNAADCPFKTNPLPFSKKSLIQENNQSHQKYHAPKTKSKKFQNQGLVPATAGAAST